MPATQVQVGAPSNISNTDGQLVTQLGGKSAEGIVSELHGKYYTQCYRGNVFLVSTIGAGLAHPVASTTAPVVALWNPSASGKNAVLLRYTSASTLNATTVQGSILLLASFNAGNTVATGAVFTAFNRSVLGTNLFNGILGQGAVSVMNASANGTNTLTAASVAVVATLGVNNPTTVAGAVAAPSVAQIIHDFDGTVIVPPGVAVYVVGSSASVALATQTLSWEEVPI